MTPFRLPRYRDRPILFVWNAQRSFTVGSRTLEASKQQRDLVCEHECRPDQVLFLNVVVPARTEPNISLKLLVV